MIAGIYGAGLGIAANVWQLSEGGDFEALHCHSSTNFDNSTKLDLTTNTNRHFWVGAVTGSFLCI
jgi:hypothetical protein